MTDNMIQILNLLSQGANSSSSNVVQYSSDTALVNYKHKRSIGNSIQFNSIQHYLYSAKSQQQLLQGA